MLSRLAYGIVGLVVVALSFSATLLALNTWSGNSDFDVPFTASIRPVAPAPSPSAAPALPAAASPTSVAVRETPAEALPKVQSRGFQWNAVAHLLVQPATSTPVVAGQPVLRLVPSPQDGFHTLAGQFSGLNKNQAYRVTAWVKPDGAGNVQLEIGDEPAAGQTPHHLAAIFSLANHTVRDGDVVIKEGGFDQGPDGWLKIWLNLVTSDGRLDVTVRPANGDILTYKGDGNLGLILGGVEINPRS
jgi:hypothetical protein